jgi:hypothetical protein
VEDLGPVIAKGPGPADPRPITDREHNPNPTVTMGTNYSRCKSRIHAANVMFPRQNSASVAIRWQI